MNAPWAMASVSLTTRTLQGSLPNGKSKATVSPAWLSVVMPAITSPVRRGSSRRRSRQQHSRRRCSRYSASQPALGRNFSATDDSPSANGTALLSWNLWRRRFGGDVSIVGQTILLNARPYTVIGVMPSWFAYPYSTVQLWTPAYHENTPAQMQVLDDHEFRAVGRLKPGFSLSNAVTELSLISLRIHDAHRGEPFVSSGANGRFLLESIVGDTRTTLLILLGATGCVLLIACLNISNLLVARSVARRRELAIRTALGGSRAELLRQHLTESLLLSVAGGALGLCLAYGLVHWFVNLRQDMPRVDAICMDGVVLAFTGMLVVLSAIFAGLVSAFSSRGDQVLSALQESSRSHSGGNTRTWMRRALLAVEVGLTVAEVASGPRRSPP
jgi:predicted permease